MIDNSEVVQLETEHYQAFWLFVKTLMDKIRCIVSIIMVNKDEY